MVHGVLPYFVAGWSSREQQGTALNSREHQKTVEKHSEQQRQRETNRDKKETRGDKQRQEGDKRETRKRPWIEL